MHNRLWILYILTFILIGIVVAFLVIFFQRRKITKEIKICIEDHLHIQIFLKRFSLRTLFFYSGLVEKIASYSDFSIPILLGIDSAWVDVLRKRRSVKNLKRVLRFCREKGLYEAFLAVIEKPKLRPIFLNYLQEQKIEVILNLLAKQAYLLEFDGSQGLSILEHQTEEVVKLSKSSSPDDRWFAFKILAFLEDDMVFASEKWEAFQDHSYRIRMMMIQNIQTENREKLYEFLFFRLINDTEWNIRKEVKSILINEYADLYKPQFNNLNVWQKNHFAENFTQEFEIDKKIAFELLLEENLELRQFAADFLNKTDTLKKLILSVDCNDIKRIEYAYTLLKGAMDVYSDEFLSTICESNNPGALMCATLLLNKVGDRREIEVLARSIFELGKNRIIEPLQSELYLLILKCIENRGCEGAFQVLKKELMDNRYNEELATLLLDYIPARADVVFIDLLLAFIQNPKITYREKLLKTCERMPQEILVPEMIRILKSPGDISWNIRLNAIGYFKNQNLELCFQYILENLNLFNCESRKEAINNLYSYSPILFKETVDYILKNQDSRSSTVLIEVLYASEDDFFIPAIKAGLETSSAKIRYSSILGLASYAPKDFYDSIIPLLNDSDKDVRLLAAEMLAKSASDSKIHFVRETIMDENEMRIVKKALITGLIGCKSHQSEEILLEAANKIHPLYDHIFSCFLMKDLGIIAKHLITLYPTMPERSQKMICQFFRYKGIEEQEILLDFLKESISELDRKSVCEILYKTGFIDNMISRLRNKSSDLRGSALQKLLVIDTFFAHKGILLATRDNNKAIRIVAFEKIRELLKKRVVAIEELKNDSSRIVQKNILWVLNKIEKEKDIKK